MTKNPVLSSFQLRYIRLNILKISVTELAELLGKASSTVSNYEHGYTNISAEVSKEILRLAGLTKVPKIDHYINPAKERNVEDLRDKTTLVSQYIHDITTNSLFAQRALFDGKEAGNREIRN